MHRRYRKILKSLQPFLDKQNFTTYGGKKIGNVQRIKRKTTLTFLFKQLRDSRYQLKDVNNFKERHFILLFNKWVKEGLSSSTIHNRSSILRIFSNEWLNKDGMIKTTAYYNQANPISIKRTTAATISNCWSDIGIDPYQIINKIKKCDIYVAMQLEFQLIFKLRKKESFLLKPRLADLGDLMLVQWGTKGGRDRVVNIDTEEKKELMRRAVSLAKTKNQSLIPNHIFLKAWEKHYEKILNQFGVNKKVLGISSHGLRHEGANSMYERSSGLKSSIRGGCITESQKLRDELARDLVSLSLGHSRRSITSAYLGTQKIKKETIIE